MITQARFAHQTVLITGANGALVEAFHAEGAHVVVGARRLDAGELVAERLGDRASARQVEDRS